jgi:uncharacterized membrane protein
MTDAGNSKNWVATLTPYRSLTRRGFLAVMMLIAVVNFAGGLVFYLIGAWPVVGFCGFDVAIMYLAFRANFVDGQREERIEITGHELILTARRAREREHVQRFVRKWVRVELEEDSERDLVGRLFLRSHGQRTEIGRFLAPQERKSLAAELRRNLATLRI